MKEKIQTKNDCDHRKSMEKKLYFHMIPPLRTKWKKELNHKEEKDDYDVDDEDGGSLYYFYRSIRDALWRFISHKQELFAFCEIDNEETKITKQDNSIRELPQRVREGVV